MTGREEHVIVNRFVYLYIGEDGISALSAVDTYKYLGINLGVGKGFQGKAGEVLRDGLKNLRRVLLKPQQRMFMLRVHLLPRLYHELVFMRTTKQSLNKLDLAVRRAVWEWLRLSPDTSNAYFHASHKAGGMGIPSLRYAVPLMRLKRLNNLSKCTDPAIEHLVAESGFLKGIYRSIGGLVTLDGFVLGTNCTWSTSGSSVCMVRLMARN